MRLSGHVEVANAQRYANEGRALGADVKHKNNGVDVEVNMWPYDPIINETTSTRSRHPQGTRRETPKEKAARREEEMKGVSKHSS